MNNQNGTHQNITNGMPRLMSPSPSGIVEKIAFKTAQWIGSVPSVIVHTLLFIAAFMLRALGVSIEEILLVVTTLVSLEAIYLSIFIQMTINHTTHSIQEVGQDIEEIHENVKELGEDIEEISVDIYELQEDEEAEVSEEMKAKLMFERIQTDLQKLSQDIETLKSQKLNTPSV